MKIYFACDHQGAKVKDDIINYLTENGFLVYTSDKENYDTDDYPDFVGFVCKNVLENKGLGILVCGTGIGMSITANKYKGIRCARVVDSNDAFTAKNHNGANVVAFSANLDLNTIYDIIDNFIATKGPSEERHLRRIEKIDKIERDNLC